MGGNLVDVEQRQTMTRKHRLTAEQAEVAEVLVIELVELVPFDRGHDVRELDRHDTLWFQDDRDAAHEVVEIGYLSEHVGTAHEIGDSACCRHLPRLLD